MIDDVLLLQLLCMGVTLVIIDVVNQSTAVPCHQSPPSVSGWCQRPCEFIEFIWNPFNGFSVSIYDQNKMTKVKLKTRKSVSQHGKVCFSVISGIVIMSLDGWLLFQHQNTFDNTQFKKITVSMLKHHFCNKFSVFINTCQDSYYLISCCLLWAMFLSCSIVLSIPFFFFCED